MAVGFNKARGKASLARVHGSLGHLPWAALPSRSAGSGSCPSLGNLIGKVGVNFTQRCFLAAQRKPVRPRGFTRTCLRRHSPPDPSPLARL